MTTSLSTDESNASAQAIALARESLATYWECFWFRADDAPVNTRSDVDLIIRRLRQYGGRAAWDFAYRLEQSL